MLPQSRRSEGHAARSHRLPAAMHRGRRRHEVAGRNGSREHTIASAAALHGRAKRLITRNSACPSAQTAEDFPGCDVWAWGRGMRKQDVTFDYHRYRQLLADADNDDKRMALINILIEERARDRLAAQIAGDRAAMTASTIAKVLGPSRR